MSCYRSVSDIFSISLSTFFSLLVLFIEGVIVARALDCSANLYLTLLLSPFSLSPGSHILSFSLSHVDTHPCTLRRTRTHAHTHSHSNTRTFFPLLFWSSREHKGLRVFHSIFVLFCLALNLSLLHKLSLSLSFFYFVKRNPNQVMMEQLSFHPDFFFFFQIFERFMFFSSRCC